MSRIRTIKPDFFLHDELAELTPLNRLLFIGIWTLADCEGRLEDRPKRIRAQLHPYDDGDTDAMLQSLHDRNFITRYSVGGVGYIEINNFKKHQRISGKEAESESSIPKNPNVIIDIDNGSAGEALGKQQGSTGEIPNAQERKGKERKGKEEEEEKRVPPAQARRARTIKTPIPADLSITPELQAWADERGYREPLDAHLENFIGKATAKGYSYADWQAALRNAIRDDWAGLRNIPHQHQRATPPAPARISSDPRIAEVQQILAGATRNVIEGECAHVTH
jgi:hypothetical protein